LARTAHQTGNVLPARSRGCYPPGLRVVAALDRLPVCVLCHSASSAASRSGLSPALSVGEPRSLSQARTSATVSLSGRVSSPAAVARAEETRIRLRSLLGNQAG